MINELVATYFSEATRRLNLACFYLKQKLQ